jgi:hypothetical protein
LSSTYDEEILTLEAGDVLEGSLDTLRDFTLILVADQLVSMDAF